MMKEKPEESIQVSDIVNTYRGLLNEPYGGLIYKFASIFMNENAGRLSVVMNWNEKWTFEV